MAQPRTDAAPTDTVLSVRSGPAPADGPRSGPEWADFYEGWEARAQAPDASRTTIDAERAVFRGMFLDLADVRRQLLDAAVDPPLVVVVADVLHVPAGTSLATTGGVLQVVARRVQTEQPLVVTLRPDASTSSTFVLYCAELAGSVRVVAVPPRGASVSFLLDAAPPTGGVRVGVVDGLPTSSPLGWAQGVTVQPPDWFVAAMRTELAVASVLASRHPGLAVRQLRWLTRWTGFDPELAPVFWTSSTLLGLLVTRLAAEQGAVAVVPERAGTAYGEVARSAVDRARQLEADYRALRFQHVVDEHFVALARTLLANRTEDGAFPAALLDRARADAERAQAAADAERRVLAEAGRAARTVASTFAREGVEAWRARGVDPAVTGLSTAAVTFAVGVAAVVGGDRSGTAWASGDVGAAITIGASTPVGIEIALARRLSETVDDLRRGAEEMGRVRALTEAVEALVADLENAASAADTVRTLTTGLEASDLGGPPAWSGYRQASEEALRGPADAGLELAATLRRRVDDVAVSGTACAAAGVAALVARQRVVALELRRQLARRRRAELEARVDALQVGSPVPVGLLQGFHELCLDAKADLLDAVEACADPLPESGTLGASLADRVGALAERWEDLTAAGPDTAGVRRVRWARQVVLDDPELLSDLSRDGEGRWRLDLEAAGLADLDRLRLGRVRLWLEGVRPGAGGVVAVQLSTSGCYQDQVGGRARTWTTEPLVLDLRYRVDDRVEGSAWIFADGTYAHLEVDGDLTGPRGAGSSWATPGAGWGARVRGDEVDASGITRLVMELEGWGTARA